MARFLGKRRATSLTSYGLVVGLIAVVALTATRNIGDSAERLFDTSSDAMQTATGQTGDGPGSGEDSEEEEEEGGGGPVPGGCTVDSGDAAFTLGDGATPYQPVSTGSITVDADETDCVWQFRVAGGGGASWGTDDPGGYGGQNEFTFVTHAAGTFNIVVGGGGTRGSNRSGGGGASSVSFTPDSTGTPVFLSIAGGGGGSGFCGYPDSRGNAGSGAGEGYGGPGDGCVGFGLTPAGGGNGVGSINGGSGFGGSGGFHPQYPTTALGGGGIGAGTGGDAQDANAGTGGGGYGGGSGGTGNGFGGGGGGGHVFTENGAVSISAGTASNRGYASNGGQGLVTVVSVTPGP